MSQDNARSPVVAYLLWFFLGGFGAHRFFMGRMGSGFGMLGLFVGSTVLSVVGIGLFGYLALFAWWVADAFMMTKWFNTEQAAPAQTAEPTSSFDTYADQDTTSQAA